MAKVTIEQRCNGPLDWSSVRGERRLTPLGLCGTAVKIEFDDELDYDSRLADVIQSSGLKCDKCSEDGKEKLAVSERLRQKRIDSIKKGRSFSSEGGKEHLF
jgi:hypothetical protein